MTFSFQKLISEYSAQSLTWQNDSVIHRNDLRICTIQKKKTTDLINSQQLMGKKLANWIFKCYPTFH